jgi:hypothetical protein
MPARLKTPEINGVSSRFTPHTRAAGHSRSAKLLQAMCVPTKEDEQAVSTLSDGPLIANVYDSRPAATLSVLPVPMNALVLRT